MRIPLISQKNDDSAKDFWGNLTKNLGADKEMLKMASSSGVDRPNELVKEGMVISYKPPTGEYTVKLGHRADVVVTGVAKQESDLQKQIHSALSYVAHLSPKFAKELEDIEVDKRNQFIYKDIDRCRDCVYFFSDTSNETYRDKCKNCTFATLDGKIDNFFPRSHHMVVYIPNWFDMGGDKPKSAFQNSLSLLDAHRTGSANDRSAEGIAHDILAKACACTKDHPKTVCLGTHMLQYFQDNGLNFQTLGKAVVESIEKEAGLQIAIADAKEKKVIIVADASALTKKSLAPVLGRTSVATTSDAQDFISKKIKILRDEGKPEDQAAAIAYSMARKEGYDVPEKKASAACCEHGALPPVRQKELDKYEEDIKDKAPDSRQLKPQVPGKKVASFEGTLCLAEVK